MLDSAEWLEMLWRKRNGRRATIVVGDQFGDNCKRTIESAIGEHFKSFVRVAGGSNTGGTCYIRGQDGQLHEMIFHLVPSGWPEKTGVIGDWVLVDLRRLTAEIDQILSIVGVPKAELQISRRAPLWLPYYSLVEAYLELVKGDDAIGTTKRGIAPTIASVDLRIGPLVGHLLDPDLLRKWVTTCYYAYEPMLKALERAGAGVEDSFTVRDFQPDRVTDELLSLAPRIKPYVAYTDPIIREILVHNEPALFGLTQGFGLFRNGTYPYSSATHTIASAAAYCSAAPMQLFGPVILASKLIGTRVGAGPYPTGWWDRAAAERFPLKNPELFSVLPECLPERREAFLSSMRAKINAGNYTLVDLAQYMQVLLNNLGATTKRGREPGGPDLHLTACACWANGVDVIALSQVNALSGLKMEFPVGTGYLIDGRRLAVPTVPTPVEEFSRVTVQYEQVPVDLTGVDLWGATELPDCVNRICDLYHLHTGAPVGLISTSPLGNEGKVFREVC